MATDTAPAGTSALLQAILNLSKFHREHEKFYASAPREFAVVLQRHARSLQALADQWAITEPSARAPLSPYEGAEDLNSAAALQLDGVLFMEGEGRPTEITHLIRDLRAAAEDQRGTGEWLARAMQSSWDMAAALIGTGGLADVLGERHRIIANDWQAAHMNTLMSHLLDRAADILEHVDFTPKALRVDLAGEKVSIGRLYSAAELISHAADLCSDSAGLVHDNERRWRTFRQRVGEVATASQHGPPA
jgi:predicted ArsR family transcriptional regulator